MLLIRCQWGERETKGVERAPFGRRINITELPSCVFTVVCYVMLLGRSCWTGHTAYIAGVLHKQVVCSNIYCISYRSDSESFYILSWRKNCGQNGWGRLIPLCYSFILIGFTLEGGERNFFEIFLNIFQPLFLATALSIIHLGCSSVFFKPLSRRNVTIYQLVRVEWLSSYSAHTLLEKAPACSKLGNWDTLVTV